MLTTYDESVEGKKPDIEEIKLSDLFKEVPKNRKLSFELIVNLINLSIGNNKQLMINNPKLYGYAVIIDKIRTYEKEELLGIEKPTVEQRREALRRAIKRAMDYCLDKGILADFIKENAMEVYNMLTEEFDITVAERIWKEEAWEEGREEGRYEILNLVEQGYTAEQIKTMLSANS